MTGALFTDDIAAGDGDLGSSDGNCPQCIILRE
jgi:hypothetical protein